MSKAPASQLYWKDWVSDIDLRRCSWAAQGVWMRVLALLHESPEYGVVRWPLKELADTAGVPIKFLRELAQKNVLKGGDNFDTDYVHVPRHAGRDLDPVTLVKADGASCWFSARFVRDAWTKSRRGAGSRFTSDNQPTGSPTRRMGERQGDGPAFASASASSIDTTKRTDTSVGDAGELARALHQVGFPECSGKAPDLLRAKDAGVTPEELAGVALEAKCQGKPLAYVVERAIGKRADAMERQTPGTQVPKVDPEEVQRKAEVSNLEDQLLDLRHRRDRLGMLDAEQYAAQAAPVVKRLAELRAEASSA